MAKLQIKLVKSTIGRLPKHRATIQALGLRKINSVVVKEDNPQMRGMIHQVGYLLEVEEI
jgi:large subunit ribosomal protein L30